MANSDPYMITLSSPKIASEMMDRFKALARGDAWAEIRPEFDQWKLCFGSSDGLAYYVYCDGFEEAKSLGSRWGGLR